MKDFGICQATQKRSYDTVKIADKHAEETSRKNTAGPSLNSYECEECGGWHVGHVKRGVSK